MSLRINDHDYYPDEPHFRPFYASLEHFAVCKTALIQAKNKSQDHLNITANQDVNLNISLIIVNYTAIIELDISSSHHSGLSIFERGCY